MSIFIFRSLAHLRIFWQITIEGDEIKLWYFSRSHSAVSEPVNYQEVRRSSFRLFVLAPSHVFPQDPRILVQIFMSFIFATSTEMGYDENVTHHSPGSYTFTIPENPPRHFMTVRKLHEYRSNNITDRMTRVWLVKEVGSPVKP